MKRLPFPLEPGTVLLGKYRIERLLGKGGMAVVYLAHHEMLQQDVAIKILLPDVAEKPENASRFLNEARAAVRLRNEHVATVMDIGVLEDDSAYIVLEYLDGLDLEQVLEANGPMPWQQVVDYVLQALEAVAQAHALGIVHRDLKPSNLFIAKRPNGTPILKVLDFGISKITNTLADGSVTSTKTMLGSPVFMSPEQLRSAKKVDHRTDIWAIGVVFYHLLTGGFPYEAESIGELFAAVLEQMPASIRAMRPDVPPELEAIYRRCLSRNVDERYPNVAELAFALEPLASADGKISVAHIRKTLGAGEAVSVTSARPVENKAPAPPANIATGPSTAAEWSESLATTKKSPLPRTAAIGGAVVVLCALGVAFAVWPAKAPTTSVVGSTAVTTPSTPEPPPSATAMITAAVTAAPPSPTASTLATAPEPTHTAVTTTLRGAPSASSSAHARSDAPPKSSAANADILLMQRN
jgi:serine/threonine protein kinase